MPDAIFESLARNWAIVVALVTVASLIAVPWLVIRKYVRIALNLMRTERPPLSHSPRDFQPVRGEPVAFTAYDGVRLQGLIVRPEAPSVRGLVIFAHEFGGDMTTCARYCRPLLDAGFAIFTFDFRGHGISEAEPGYVPSQWVTDRELFDMRGALVAAREWLSSQGREPRVGLLGISRGACASVLLAAESDEVRGVVLDGVFSTDWILENLMRRWAAIFSQERVPVDIYPASFWRMMRRCVLARAIREFRAKLPSVRRVLETMRPCPLLFIRGERDSYLPAEQTRDLYALAPQPKSLWVAPGAKHNQAAVLHRDAYARLTSEFFLRHLDARLPASPAAPLGVRASSGARSTSPV